MTPVALLHLALAFQASVGVTIGNPGDSARRAREAARRANREMWSDDGPSRREKKPGRRIPVTDELRASAFRDPAARSLLLRARVARMTQDSMLQSYDANTYQRLSVGLGFKAFGRDRLAIRGEDAAHVRWVRGRGAWVDVTGRRSVSPLVGKGDGDTDVDLGAPIPYYPGREDLWIAGGLAQAQVDEQNFVHPIAEGAEAYYTYESGDSLIITLPDGKRLTLRELKIMARWPKWNLSVGSFWFDEESAHLVRAAYRLSMPLDVWAVEKEEREANRRDSTRRGDGPPAAAKAFLSPMKVDVSAITVDYGLYNQRFWLPRAQALEGIAQVSFMRVPMTMQQRFKYQDVNGLDSLPTMPERRLGLVRALRDSLDSAKTPRPVRDSLVRAFTRARAKELENLQAKECAATGAYTTLQRRYESTVTVATRVPCDTAKLANSPDLPPSIYDPGEEVFSTADRDQLVKALSFGLQPAWGPQRPQVEWGLSKTRYNRIEGFSTGATLTSVLGRGYTTALGARGSLADRQANGDLTLSRSNGRSTVRGTVYRRLDVMNDWGTPLSFGASLGSLLYARDEGAYFRTWGAEVAGQHPTWGTLDWRLFAERQSKADVRSRWTLFGGGNDSRFIANPSALAETEYGGSVRLHSSVGLDPEGFRVLSDVRVEGAGGGSSYVRALFDETLSRSLGKEFAASLTASAGYSGGTLPVQRLFYLGGSQTVRGQTALTASGDAFWLAHAELGRGSPAARLIAFSDVGWAGDRRSWSTPGRPLSGAGAGFSMLDGLIRLDVARGLFPAKQWRADIYLEAKF
ncbi:MAG: ShlB/FhaC/HecB family hemolysin secretion/activation protein [Gemmatimonadales bacterium]